MFSRRKPERPRPKSARNGAGLSQFGLFDIPDVNNLDAGMSDDDDADLEAELLALTSSSGSSPRPKRVSSNPKPAVPLDAMVAASLKDIPSDESMSDDGDDDDPDLLEELNAITGEVSDEPAQPQAAVTQDSGVQQKLLLDRLAMYKAAEASSTSVGDTARARRFTRGIKTINDLIKQVAAGKAISEDDIPPPVSTTASSKPEPPPAPTTQVVPTPTRVAPAPPPVPVRVGVPLPGVVPPPVPVRLGVPLPGLVQPADVVPPSVPPPVPVRLGVPLPGLVQPADVVPPPVPTPSDTEVSEKVKTLSMLTERRDQYKRAALGAKKSGDMNSALSYVRVIKQFDAVINAVETDQPVDLSEMPPPLLDEPTNVSMPVRKRRSSENQGSSEPPTTTQDTEPESSDAVIEEPEYTVDIPKTIIEALEQRLAKYISQEESAKAENNASKVRRMGRIVKQYNDAIKQHKAGKQVAFDELPTPPGYPPIPVPGAAKPEPTPSPQSPAKTSKLVTTEEPETSTDKPNVRKMGGSRQEKQLAALMARQKQFKLAALEAKKKGELNQAKEYLRLAKGFEPLIEAANCGLPVDMTSVPVSPENKVVLESDFDVVTADDCLPGSDSDIYDKLQADLLSQLKKFMETRNHFKAIGDITSANRFEQQALHTKKDLDLIKFAHKNRHPVPKFHYEMKSFSIVQCNTDLGDNDVELVVVQGINYNVPNPKEVDTYIRFEFPFPSEEPFRDKTSVVYNTNNPVYDEKFTIPIQRSARACQRIFKRQALKCEVWSKGGFFRSDSLIGTVSVKLQALENVCNIHDAFNLMDGRKAVGGKLEVKLRVRNPILTKQIEQVQEKWLVIDN